MARHEEIVLFTQPRYVPGGHDQKSVIRKFLDVASLGAANKVEGMAERQFGTKHVSTFLETFREYSEASVTGGTLGFLCGKGLIEVGGVPIDAAASLAGFVGRIAAGADSGIGKTLGDIGATSTGIYWFRMAERWAKEKRRSGVHGDYDPDDTVDAGEDPVVEAAKQL